MSKKEKQMSEEQDAKIVLTDEETGEEYIFEGRGSSWKEGADFGGSIRLTTNKTEAVIFKLAYYVATKEPGAPGVSDARKALQIIRDKLDSFTLGIKEDGKTFFASWRVKEGLRKETVDKEVDEALSAEIFKAFVIGVFTPERLKQGEKPAEIARGGEGFRVGAQWSKSRFEIKKARKETKKTTPEEFKLELVINKLLRDYSEHRDKDHHLYLLGNGGEVFEEARVAIGGDIAGKEQLRAAVLEIPQTVIYQAYTGKKSSEISSKERRRVDELLEALQKDILRIILKEEMSNGSVKWYEIERPKITVDRIATLTREEAAARDNGEDLPEGKTSLRITLHPGFTFDIGRKYSLLPDDYLTRMERAIGGGRSSAKHWLLCEYLNGVRGQGKQSGYETSANFETLLTHLELERLKAKQGAPKAEAEIDEAARVAKEVGLILSWSKETGAKGQKKWIFKLNPEFV